MTKLSKPHIRTPYNYDRDLVSYDTGLYCFEPTKAQQQFREECDINTIVRNFGVTGQVNQPRKLPEYGDFTGVDDYQSALNQINASKAAFMALPARLRDRFHNNPDNLLKFIMNEQNRDEAVLLGLIEKTGVTADAVQPEKPADA